MRSKGNGNCDLHCQNSECSGSGKSGSSLIFGGDRGRDTFTRVTIYSLIGTTPVFHSHRLYNMHKQVQRNVMRYAQTGTAQCDAGMSISGEVKAFLSEHLVCLIWRKATKKIAVIVMRFLNSPFTQLSN